MAKPTIIDKVDRQELEAGYIIDALYQFHGYDFRNYEKRSVISRLSWRTQRWQLQHISELLPLILHSKKHLQILLSDLSITVTEMFRDPALFSKLVEEVFPYLDTFPFFKIWHAGCSTGEEVYSLAILLHEHGLYERAQIYATDFNPMALKTAREGIYPESNYDHFNKQYKASGGKFSLDRYFTAGFDNMLVDRNLKRRIVFSLHNLVADGSFGVMELIICRNVLIYFDKNLKLRVIKLFNESLYHNGFLFLGSSETMKIENSLELMRVEKCASLFRKVPKTNRKQPFYQEKRISV